jgi:ATP-dependent helicase YprA (DUF1998 family)
VALAGRARAGQKGLAARRARDVAERGPRVERRQPLAPFRELGLEPRLVDPVSNEEQRRLRRGDVELVAARLALEGRGPRLQIRAWAAKGFSTRFG